MYSSFKQKSYYVYLADKMGQPLGDQPLGLTTPGLKKIFESQRRAAFMREDETAKPDSALADRSAGVALLRYLEGPPVVRRQRPGLLPGLQVRRVNLFWKPGRIEAETQIVAQHQ
jgi:hypothetical protein